MTIIPDDHVYVDSFSLLNDKVQEQLKITIEEKSQPNESKPFRLVRKLYQACMEKSKIIKNK